MAHYVKLVDDPTFWFVEDGKRVIVGSPEQMYGHGLHPIHTVSPEELNAIPLVGESRQDVRQKVEHREVQKVEQSDIPKADAEGAAAFLSVVTRCYKRPKMLLRNKASLGAQTDPDYQQVFIVDDVGRGIGWANQQLADRVNEAMGRYVMVLDDDDLLVDETLIATIKHLAAKEKPDLIIAKMDHGELGVLPDDEYWEKRPEHGRIGMSAWIAQNGLYRAAVQQIENRRAGDVAFYRALYDQAKSIYWLDRVISRVQRTSWGEPE